MNNLIPNTSANKLYVAHSVAKKSIRQEKLESKEINEVTPSKAAPIQIINRSYYYDSTGGGYQGL